MAAAVKPSAGQAQVSQTVSRPGKAHDAAKVAEATQAALQAAAASPAGTVVVVNDDMTLFEVALNTVRLRGSTVSDRPAPASALASHKRTGSVKMVDLRALLAPLFELAQIKGAKNTYDAQTVSAVLPLIQDETHAVYCRLDGAKDSPCILIPAKPLQVSFPSHLRVFFQMIESDVMKFQAQYVLVDYASKPPTLSTLQTLPEINARNSNYEQNSEHSYQFLVLIFKGGDPSYSLTIGLSSPVTPALQLKYGQAIRVHKTPQSVAHPPLAVGGSGAIVQKSPAAKGDSPRFDAQHKQPSPGAAAAGAGSGAAAAAGALTKVPGSLHGRSGSIQLITLSQFIEGFLSQYGFKQVVQREGKKEGVFLEMQKLCQTVQCLAEDGKKACILIPVTPLKHGIKPGQQEFFQLTEPEMGKFQGEFLSVVYKGEVVGVSSLFKMDLVNARNKGYTASPSYKALDAFFSGQNSDYIPKEERTSSPHALAVPAGKTAETLSTQIEIFDLFSLNDLLTLLLAHAENKKIQELNAPQRDILKGIQDATCAIKCLRDDGKGPCILIPADPIKKEHFKATSRVFLQITTSDTGKFHAKYIHVDYAQVIRTTDLHSLPEMSTPSGNYMSDPYHPLRIWELPFKGKDPFYRLKIGTNPKVVVAAVHPTSPSPAEIFYKQLLFPKGEPSSGAEGGFAAAAGAGAAGAAAGNAKKLPALPLQALMEKDFLRALPHKLTVSKEPFSTVMQQAEEGGVFLCKDEDGTEVCLSAVVVNKSLTPVINSVGSALFSMRLAESDAEDEKVFLILYHTSEGAFNVKFMVYPTNEGPYPLETLTFLDTTAANFRDSPTYKGVRTIFSGTHLTYSLKGTQVHDE